MRENMVKKGISLFLLTLIVLISSGCGQIEGLGLSGVATNTSIPEPTTTPEAVQIEGDEVGDDLQPVNLIVWIPDDLFGSPDSEKSLSFQSRIDLFLERHPGVRIEIRTKLADDSGGIINSLLSSQESASLGLPDVVILDQDDLKIAFDSLALKPLEDLSFSLEDRQYFPYTYGLSQIDGQAYSLPFMGDAYVMYYRNAVVGSAPTKWGDLIAMEGAMLFPGSDPNAIYTEILYRSLGGDWIDESQNATVNVELMAQVLNFYDKGREAGTFPFWLTQYETNMETWQAFIDGRGSAILNLYSLSGTSSQFQGVNVAPLPTQSGAPFSLGTGWSVAVTSQDEASRGLATQLAEFICTPEYLAEFSQTFWYLPVDAMTLSFWEDGDLKTMVASISPFIEMIPPENVRMVVEQPLSQTVVSLLKQEKTLETIIGELQNLFPE